jgi:hypothetical protein
MAEHKGPTGTAKGGVRQPEQTYHGTRGGDENAAGGGTGGMPPGDANNANPDSGYRHWHFLGDKKPPGYMIGEVHAPDSGSNPKAKAERKVQHDPAPGKMDPMRQVGPNVKPIGS